MGGEYVVMKEGGSEGGRKEGGREGLREGGREEGREGTLVECIKWRDAAVVPETIVVNNCLQDIGVWLQTLTQATHEGAQGEQATQ